MSHQRRTISPRVVVQMLVFIVVVPFLPLLISGHWDWWEAWTYALIGIFGFVIGRALVARRHPDLLAERARFLKHEDAAPWDKRLAPLVGLGGALVPLVAILAGYALGSYALLANRFFSGMVRIQAERGHHVVSNGPYRWVRHPGYAGALLTYLATPIFLDAAWAFLPALFLTIVLVIRTRLEDRTLQEQLEGYRDYAARVHFRLLPGVW
jgi:protein-S-isoprenylcysteine O-methyltransferase Ste14